MKSVFWVLLIPFFPVAVLADGPPKPVVVRDLPYVAGGHERQKLDLYIPPGVAPKAPLLVWIHGGAWKEGSKDDCPGVAMTRRGWVVASLNYRLSQHAPFPAQIEDCKAAIRFLRARAGDFHIDPERVAVWGASAGGHLAALLAVTGGTREFDRGANPGQSSAVSCVVDWFGPSDFLNWRGDGSANADGVVAQLLGGPVSGKRELAKKASPVTWVDASSAPMLIMHGDKDPLVPLWQSEELARDLKAAGVACVLKVYPGQGHGGPLFSDEAARALMVDFVDRHTIPRKAAR